MQTVFVDDVTVPTRLRQVDEATVGRLTESMAEIGLQQPISVWSESEYHVGLVAGAHRLAAAKRLGWEEIACVFVDLSQDQRQLWEIDENLMRSELSQAEYSRHVALRKEIYERLHPETAHGGHRGNQHTGGKPASRQVGDMANDRFTADTAAKTGKSERSVQRAAHRGERIAEDVLARIKGTRFDTGSYQDQLAKLDHEAQREKVERDLTAPAPATQSPPKNQPQNYKDADEEQLEALKRAWNKASKEARAQFLDWVHDNEPAVFDNSRSAA